MQKKTLKFEKSGMTPSRYYGGAAPASVTSEGLVTKHNKLAIDF